MPGSLRRVTAAATVRRILTTTLNSVLIGALLALGSGCAEMRDCSLTARLWSNEELRSFREPARNPDLHLYQTADARDVLVAYDELRERDGTYTRRAYFLNANAGRVEARRKPHFVDAEKSKGLKPIPVTGDAPQIVPENLRATLSPDGRQFTLYSGDKVVGVFNLPAYEDSSGTAMRVALTPLAVAGDTVAVALVAAVLAAYLYAGCGCYDVHYCH